MGVAALTAPTDVAFNTSRRDQPDALVFVFSVFTSVMANSNLLLLNQDGHCQQINAEVLLGCDLV
tara:strand:- start:483 stop:677 length:195 start_codon:yes stop_codon:yes gene_type:complete